VPRSSDGAQARLTELDVAPVAVTPVGLDGATASVHELVEAVIVAVAERLAPLSASTAIVYAVPHASPPRVAEVVLTLALSAPFTNAS
jgi:hypothetical protein